MFEKSNGVSCANKPFSYLLEGFKKLLAAGKHASKKMQRIESIAAVMFLINVHAVDDAWELNENDEHLDKV